MTDGRVYRNSNAKKLIQRQAVFALAADSAYPISRTVVKPYPYANRPTQSHKDFNYAQARLRNDATEKIFGQVKSRFRILHSGLRTSVKKSQLIIASCLVLHNMAQIFGNTRFGMTCMMGPMVTELTTWVPRGSIRTRRTTQVKSRAGSRRGVPQLPR